MSMDKGERRHRRTAKHPECVRTMAEANFEGTMSLEAAMGMKRCIHGGPFPCAQCGANRRWNEAATGKKLTEREFEERYTQRFRCPQHGELCREDVEQAERDEACVYVCRVCNQVVEQLS